MKRKIAVAVLSIFSLAIPQFASAGQGPNYRDYNQGNYTHDGYAQTAHWGDRQYDREWNHHRDDRDSYYRNGYYGNNGYYGDQYDNRYYDDRDHHAGRSTAIIGGSAAAGAVLGAAAGQGKGAAIGAVIGGVAGVIADQAVRHHDRRWNY